MSKALILTWEKFQDHEVIYPYYRVQEDGYEVDIMSNVVGKIYGILGTYMESTKSVFDLDDDDDIQEIRDVLLLTIYTQLKLLKIDLRSNLVMTV